MRASFGRYPEDGVGLSVADKNPPLQSLTRNAPAFGRCWPAVFVRRGQGTPARALTATDEDGRNKPADSRPAQYGWLRHCFFKKRPFRSGQIRQSLAKAKSLRTRDRFEVSPNF